jgi:hypothetical protein
MPDGGADATLLGQDESDVFIKLSALLTGLDDLDPGLAAEYRGQLTPVYGAAITSLCGLYYEVIGDPDPVSALLSRISGDPQLVTAARQIAAIWYLSQFYPNPADRKNPQLAGHFERGALWRIIDAHPPAFSARRHGYWATTPEEQ